MASFDVFDIYRSRVQNDSCLISQKVYKRLSYDRWKVKRFDGRDIMPHITKTVFELLVFSQFKF